MGNKIKRIVEKIEIPDELHARTKLGIKQVKQEKKRGMKYPKWMIGAVASLLIIGIAFSAGGSYITDATETLIGKVFGVEEQAQFKEDTQKFSSDPEGGAQEAEGGLQQMEQHLKLAEEHLSPEDYADYSMLIKEIMKINAESLNPHADQEKLEIQAKELREKIQDYEIYELTIHTLEEAKAMVSYPINYPTYIPEGYELIEEEARTEEAHPGKDPVVTLHYDQVDGEFNFYTSIQKIDHTKGKELDFYDQINSYQLNGYHFEHAYSEQTNTQSMRITIPKQGYEIIIDASLLSKKEMEKVLLSMVDQ